ncbi:MAG: ABC transporter ATP-binding protein [Anaerolineales bacterium]|nr:ABC transporter ATP-binding protein [Anaerolineales bacterium]MDP2776214.1 ABC transporter ATP-binding protein [Anaerolineales bacterium]
MTTVNIISLNKTYPNQPVPVLKDFSLSINDGEMIALLGPSGSGKSTLLKLITGIERPDSGDIQFDGSSILSIDPNKRGAVLMFQQSYLFPFLNVEDNIGFGLKVQGASAETIRGEVKRMLNLIGLPGIERRKSGQLSGGEQQRVALARALVTNPKLLLLDEPLSSLDTSVRMNLQEAIRNIQRELGVTTIFVTHDLGEAMAMSDRMALLLNGEIVALDKPENLFHRPRSLTAAKFMGVSTFLSGDQLTVKNEACSSSEKIFAIRPEHIRIQKEACKNSMLGVVSDCVFRGEYIEYQVDVNDVTVRARMPMPAPMFPHGEQVRVNFPQEHLFEVN